MLQKDLHAHDEALLLASPHLHALRADFVDTAAAIMCLDLVISVDTSIAHLAGLKGLRKLQLSGNLDIGGDQTANFAKAEPFKFLAPEAR